MSHKLKITLLHIEPEIHRTIIVPEHFTFHQLHLVIQVAMNWKDYHLYQFNLGRPYSSDCIKLPSEEDDGFFGFGDNQYSEYDSQTSFIKDVFNHSKKAIYYL